MVFSPYLILAIVVLIMNAIPVLMPATWMVLAFFTVKYSLFPVAAVLIGALAAVSGRIILAFLARTFFRRLLSEAAKGNLSALKSFFKARKKLLAANVLLFAFSPFPSNQLFIAAGLADFDLRLIAGSFFAGRLVSYSFWVGLVNHLGENLTGIFSRYYSRSTTFLIEAIGIFLILLFVKIDWQKILGASDKHGKKISGQQVLR